MEGKLIVIEGNNASGKGTQARLLVKRLSKEGYKVKGVSFPRYNTRIGRVIGKYLRGELGKLDEINPYLSSMLYAFDRLQTKAQIINWLKQGYMVVTDRYVESNMAFQAAKLKNQRQKRKFVEFIIEVEYKIGKMPKPNLIIYLNVPLNIAAELHNKKEQRNYIGKERDIHERNLRFLKEVEKIYLRLARKNRWRKIKCYRNKDILSVKEISDAILRIVKEL